MGFHLAAGPIQQQQSLEMVIAADVEGGHAIEDTRALAVCMSRNDASKASRSRAQKVFESRIS